MTKNNLLSKKFEITTSCVDANNVVTSKRLLEIIQDLAVLHANHLGLGWDVMQQDGLVWVVSKIVVENICPIVLGDVVQVDTWPLVPGRFFADREYHLKNQNGTLVAVATARWCVINYTSRSIVNPSVTLKHFEGPYREEKSGASFFDKKVFCDETFDLCYQKDVRWSDLDLNLHVNNTNYCAYALDTLDAKFLRDNYVGKMEITYHSECKFGETLQIYSKFCDGVHNVVGKKQDNVAFTYRATYKKL